MALHPKGTKHQGTVQQGRTRLPFARTSLGTAKSPLSTSSSTTSKTPLSLWVSSILPVVLDGRLGSKAGQKCIGWLGEGVKPRNLWSSSAVASCGLFNLSKIPTDNPRAHYKFSREQREKAESSSANTNPPLKVARRGVMP